MWVVLIIGNLGYEDIFNVERTGGSRSNSPPRMNKARSNKTFAIDPKMAVNKTENEPVLRSSSDRKGDLDPGLMNLLASELDEPMEQAELKKNLTHKSSEIDKDEESKHGYQEGLGPTAATKQKPQLNSAEIENQLPFKIYRPCPSTWAKNDNSADAKDAYYFNSSQNIDSVNNAQGT